jgi:phosphoribosyl-ATP pyrophosphohydrolase/phosphoribosyl-AMP cyclohydrolase
MPDIEALVRAVTFDDKGLVPVVAQDTATGVVRMVAWATAEALRATAHTGLATFWSRSRNELWQKGATSGHPLRVRELRLDCDGDTVLYLADAEGPSCHTGATSCFFRRPEGDALIEDAGPPEAPGVALSRLAAVIAARRSEAPDKSYVASLLQRGWPKILAKITEEAGEVVEALPAGDPKHTTHEAADLIFHLLVGLEAAGIPVDDVFSELRRRFGVSGLAEKAARAPRPAAP